MTDGVWCGSPRGRLGWLSLAAFLAIALVPQIAVAQPPRACWIDVATGKQATEVVPRGTKPDPDGQHASGGGRTFVRFPCPQPAATQTVPPPVAPKPPLPKTQTSMSTTGAGIQFQLRGFGGATIINGNTPSTSGFDGAVLFPLGNRVLVGPTAGFQWVDNSIIKTLGGGPPPSTFIHTTAGFSMGNFGVRVVIPVGWLQLGVHGGASVASSTITQAEGFCGTGSGGPSGPPAGCTTTSATTTHDTIVGPFVGGYVSHSIFSHVGVFVGYDYHLFKDDGLVINDSTVVGGVVLSFGRHSGK